MISLILHSSNLILRSMLDGIKGKADEPENQTLIYYQLSEVDFSSGACEFRCCFVCMCFRTCMYMRVSIISARFAFDFSVF